MHSTKLTKMFKTIRRSIKTHSPEILTGIGIAGMIATTVLAVKETPKALRCLEVAEQEKGEDLTSVEKVKACWRCYIPAAATGATSIACLVGASSVNSRRNTALAAAYKLSEKALTEYREKVVETIGEKKEKTVREKIDKKRIEENPVGKNEVIITEKGNTLCFDHLSGRYFKSDIERIKKAENVLNKQMLHDISGYVSLNDFYDEIGLAHTTIGYDMGWNVNNLIDIDFSSQIADNGEPCIVLNYIVRPEYGYSDFI